MALAFTHRAGSPDLVILHGLGLSKEAMLPCLSAEPLAHCGFFAPDLPGHAASEPYPPSQRYSFENAVASIVASLRELQIRSFHLAVHSIAANVIPGLLREPDLTVASITLLEANITGDDTQWSQSIAAMDDNALGVYVRRLRRVARTVLSQQLARPPDEAQLAAQVVALQAVQERALKELSMDAQIAVSERIVETALRRYEGKVLYVRGDDNRRWDDTKQVLRQLGVPVVPIADVGHLPMLDDPHATAAAIAECMAGQPAPRNGIQT